MFGPQHAPVKKTGKLSSCDENIQIHNTLVQIQDNETLTHIHSALRIYNFRKLGRYSLHLNKVWTICLATVTH